MIFLKINRKINWTILIKIWFLLQGFTSKKINKWKIIINLLKYDLSREFSIGLKT